MRLLVLSSSIDKYTNIDLGCQVMYSRFIMKISFATSLPSDRITGTNGYGYATVCMLDSLTKLGHEVKDNDPTADVQIAFNQPVTWKFHEGPYKIGYHPWESTQLLPGWADIMNQCDEIWTPSPLVAQWYTDYAGIQVPVHVYEHGIEHEWAPVKREPEHTIKFLHVGAEASRKGGWEAVRMFRRAFPGRKDVSLTLKMINSSWNGIPELGRVKYINETWKSIGRMRDLFYHHDVYVYPSQGEGFGLTPLQAIATGMPTITVPDWAPYNAFLDPKLSLKAELKRTQYPEIHPGMMYRVDTSDLIDRMRYAADHYDEVRDFACSNAREVHARYDWCTITEKVFNDLETRLNP